MRFQDSASNPVEIAGELSDLSATGARLSLTQPIRMNTTLTIAYREKVLTGTVRYCTRQSRGYTVGIEFTP